MLVIYHKSNAHHLQVVSRMTGWWRPGRGWFTLTRSRRVVKTRSSLTCGSGPDFMMVELWNKCNNQFKQFKFFYFGLINWWKTCMGRNRLSWKRAHMCINTEAEALLEAKNLPVQDGFLARLLRLEWVNKPVDSLEFHWRTQVPFVLDLYLSSIEELKVQWSSWTWPSCVFFYYALGYL